MENKELKARLDGIEKALKVILCCALHPKSGENDEFFSVLSEEAMKMLYSDRNVEEKDLYSLVRDIVSEKPIEDQRPKTAPPKPPPLITNISGYDPDSFFCEPINCIRSWFNKIRNKGCPDIPDWPPPPPEKHE